MKYRKFGGTGLEVSALGFGAWGIGGNDWVGASDTESLRSIQTAMEQGVNFFDTALGYGNGHSEELIGQGISGNRHRWIVATKIPPKNYCWPAMPDVPMSEVFPKDWIIECTEKSLKNLKTDYIDIQQFHVWTNGWVEEEEWKQTVLQLKRDGKIRFFGASIHFPYSDYNNALPGLDSGCLDSVQVVHNIYQQEAEKNVFPKAKQTSKGIIVRCPLDEGSLSGKITPDSVFPEGSFLENYFKGNKKIEAFEKANALNWIIEEGYASNLSEAAIRYCLSFSEVSSAIVGMRNSKHTEANCVAVDKGPLPAEALKRLKAHAWPHNFWS